MVGHLYISIDGSIDEGCISPSAIGGVVKIYGIINAKTAKKVQSCFNRPGLASPEPGSKHKPFVFEAVY